MVLIAVLRLDRNGIVEAASPEATELLGPCVGRRCCDLVLARASDRTVLCTPGCAPALATERKAQDKRGVQVRGRTCRLICGAADDQPTVVLLSEEARRADGVTLSPREATVLSLVAAGHSDRQIARALEVEPSTVKTLVSRARSKLGARTRAEAVALALRSGLIA